MTTPGSIHEGGELGYVLVHAFGAVMDNPDLLAVAVVGDGEAETGPLEGSWKGISFLNPARDGAVLPILHLNGAKIAGPTVLARKDPAEVRALLRGHGYEVHRGRGRRPAGHAPPLRRRTGHGVGDGSARSRPPARGGDWDGAPAALADDRAAHPEGLDRPGRGRRRSRSTGTWRSHQVPLSGVRDNPEHLAAAGGLAAVLPSRGALRRRTAHPVDAGAAANPDGRPADERAARTPTAAC